MIKLEGAVSLLEIAATPPTTGRALVPTVPSALPVPVSPTDAPAPLPVPDSDLMQLLGKFDVRKMSPREMAGRSIELYAVGLISWDEYAMLAFQPELHPSFDTTIGALIGERAAPDRPRNFLAEWEDRLAFELRYNAGDAEVVARTRRIVQSFRKLVGIRDTLTV